MLVFLKYCKELSFFEGMQKQYILCNSGATFHCVQNLAVERGSLLLASGSKCFDELSALRRTRRLTSPSTIIIESYAGGNFIAVFTISVSAFCSAW